MAKDCLHCRNTHPMVFDGTCPTAGELTMNWAMMHHYDCWERVPFRLHLKYLVHRLRSKKHGRSKQL
jgi:hypothetical protein